MKLTIFLLAVVLTTSCANLIPLLSYIHSQPYFDKLPADDRVILIELLAEAEMGELDAYIKRIGIPRALEVTKHMPEQDAKLLVTYLTGHLHPHQHPSQHPNTTSPTQT